MLRLPVLGFCIASLLVGATSVEAQSPRLRFAGEFRISTGLKIEGIEFGGISGLDYDAARKTFLALSDDRSEKAPARFHELEISLDAKGFAGFEVKRIVSIRNDKGEIFPRLGTDPEAIRIAPGGESLYWSSEGDEKGRPSIQEMDRNGNFRRTFELPTYYLPNGIGASRTSGIADNLGHEGLAVSRDGKTLYAALENALVQDGPKASLEAGSPARVLGFEIATGKPVAEYVYVTEAIPEKATRPPFYADNGVSEILTLPDGRLLFVERAFAFGVGNTIRLFTASLDGATNVLGRETIRDDKSVQPLKKELALTLQQGSLGLSIDNIEAVTLGPWIDGKPSLIMASDNNFNRNGQFTQFLLFILE